MESFPTRNDRPSRGSFFVPDDRENESHDQREGVSARIFPADGIAKETRFSHGKCRFYARGAFTDSKENRKTRTRGGKMFEINTREIAAKGGPYDQKTCDQSRAESTRRCSSSANSFDLKTSLTRTRESQLKVGTRA